MLLMLLMLPLTANGQYNHFTVKGYFFDTEMNEHAPQVTVRLLNAHDSSTVTGAFSDTDGAFALKAKRKGNYILHGSFVGYKSLYRNIRIDGSKAAIELGKLEILPDVIMLKGAEVTAVGAEVRVNNDTLEYNADSYKVQDGGVMEDVLRKMPGVEVGDDGKVSVNGESISKILVDGKEFFSNDPTVASKNIPAEMIDKIQVLDRQSDMARLTGFNDDDEEKVINITVKKGKKKGWFGNILGGGGYQPNDQTGRYELNGMINRFMGENQFSVVFGANNTNNMGFTDFASSSFNKMGGGGRRKGGWGGNNAGVTTSQSLGTNIYTRLSPTLTLNGDANYSRSSNDTRSKSTQQHFIADSSSFYRQNDASLNLSNNVNVNLRLEWTPDTMTKLIFKPKFSFNKNMRDEHGDFETTYPSGMRVNRGTSSYNSEGTGNAFSGKLDFARKLNNKGRVLSIDLKGGYNNAVNEGDNESNTEYFDLNAPHKSAPIDQQFRMQNTGYNYKARAIWTEPLSERNSLQIAYQFGQNSTNADKRTYNMLIDSDRGGALDSTYSRSYRNDFTTQRASIAFKSERDKFGYTIGVNLDPSDIRSVMYVGETTLTDTTRHVLNISPNIRFKYEFSRTSNLKVEYKGYAKQPSITQLQPIFDISNPLNKSIGNPQLLPSYTNRIMARYQYFVPSSQLAIRAGIFSTFSINDITSATAFNHETGGRISTYANTNGNWSANGMFMINSPFKNKRFSFSSFTRLGYNNNNTYTGNASWVEEEEINIDDLTLNTTRSINATEALNFNYRSDLFDFTLGGSVSYSSAQNTLPGQVDKNTFDYKAVARTTWHLPAGLYVESDLTYETNSGYSDGFAKNAWVWNASLSKQLFKDNSGTIRIKYYDILNQRINVSRSITSNYIQDVEYNNLGAYVMLYFNYKFNIFGGKRGEQHPPTDSRSYHRPRGDHRGGYGYDRGGRM